MPKPIYAFIDSQNLNLGVKSQGWKLNFTRFRKYLTAKHHVTKAYLFIGHIPDNVNLYHQLKKDGYSLIFKPVVFSKNHKENKVKYKERHSRGIKPLVVLSS